MSERLSKIKKYAEWGTHYIGPKNIRWLIEQAELAESLSKQRDSLLSETEATANETKSD